MKEFATVFVLGGIPILTLIYIMFFGYPSEWVCVPVFLLAFVILFGGKK